MKITVFVTTVVFIGAVAAATRAQEQGPGGLGGPGAAGRPRHGAPELMAENFFPAELVMQNQKAIELTADQQSAIKAEMQKTMAQFTDLKWQESAEQETMQSLARQDHPDEKQSLAEFNKLLNIENDIKRLQFGTMVRIKNILTPDQQARLRQIQSPPPQRPGGRQTGGGRPGESSSAPASTAGGQ
ncbi:MAG TPA: hypothetical protein VMP11_12440 [Verrucomicrobiae bacterium]|nr:hypothetical protein [Verrucomicrobiae bacterium]